MNAAVASFHSLSSKYNLKHHSATSTPSSSGAVSVNDILSQLNHYEITQPTLLSATSNNIMGQSVGAATSTDSSSLPSFYHHPSSRLFEVTAFGKQYHLIVKPTEMFGEGYKEMIMNDDGKVMEEAGDNEVQTDCWFEGHVIGDPSSIVTLTTCDHFQQQQKLQPQPVPPPAQPSHPTSSSTTPPLHHNTMSKNAPRNAQRSLLSTSFRANSLPQDTSNANGEDNSASPSLLTLSGSIRAFGEQLFIETARPHAHRLESYSAGSHIVYRSQDMKPRTEITCGVTEADRSSHQQQAHSNLGPSRHLLMSGNQHKYVEMFFVNDYLNWKTWGIATLSLAKSAVAYQRSLYMNSTGYQFSYIIDVRLVLMATLAYGDPWETPKATSSFENDANDLSSKWSSFAYSIRDRYPYDQATLMSGYNFEDSVIGRGYLGGMCNLPVSASVIQASWNLYSIQVVGAVMAHEMGHNFNFDHDTNNTYIMSPVENGSTRWSQKSVDTLNAFFDNLSQDQMCLENVPTRNWVNTTVVCGDGMIQTGEECDCGTRDCSQVDPCCDQATCLLKWNANCSVADGCCDPSTCSAYTDNRVCRGSASTCDLVERCDGKSSYCPRDTYVNAGTSCKWNSTDFAHTGSGVCYQGSCYSHAKQCFDLAAVGSIYPVNGQCTGTGDVNDNNDADCGGLYCDITGYYCGMYNVFRVPAGTPCGTGKQCNSTGSCIASSKFAAPPNNSISSNITTIRRRANYTEYTSGDDDDSPIYFSQADQQFKLSHFTLFSLTTFIAMVWVTLHQW